MTNGIVDKLKSTPPPMMVPACTTCRHFLYRNYGLSRCLGCGGNLADQAFAYQCRGDMREPRVPVLVRLKRWLIG